MDIKNGWIDLKHGQMDDWKENKNMKIQIGWIEKQMDDWMDRKKQMDGWMDRKKQMDCWMYKKNGWMDGYKTQMIF